MESDEATRLREVHLREQAEAEVEQWARARAIAGRELRQASWGVVRAAAPLTAVLIGLGVMKGRGWVIATLSACGIYMVYLHRRGKY